MPIAALNDADLRTLVGRFCEAEPRTDEAHAAVAAAEVVRMNRTYRNRIQQRDICLVLALKRICRSAPRRPAS